MMLQLIGLVALVIGSNVVSGFVPLSFSHSETRARTLYALDELVDTNENSMVPSDRRSFVSALVAASTATAAGGGVMLSSWPSLARAEEEGEEEAFASIAARASKLAVEVGEKTPTRVTKASDGRTAYDFSLPIEGEIVSFTDMIHQQYEDGRPKVKAVLVVNMKEDDPIARKDIPEFMSLASRYVFR
jgi:hypothetical protein